MGKHITTKLSGGKHIVTNPSGTPIIVAGGGTPPPPAPGEGIIYQEDFETAPFLPGVGLQLGTSYGLTYGSYHGRNCARFELRDTDPEASGGTRAEAKIYNIDDMSGEAGSTIERWYRWDAFFPSTEWAYDSKAEICTQFHQGMSTSPSISIITRYDLMVIEVRNVVGVKTQYPLGAITKDTWNQYTMHIKHSYTSAGLIEVWKDGVLLQSLSRANSYDWTAGADKPKWKLGLYKWDWNGTGTTDVAKRVLFFDNIILGDASANLI